ncbi:MAG TPA: hypothetical protein VNL12_08430 [Iamia sp.]|nr:hypothetical protein [Iamia sp.]
MVDVVEPWRFDLDVWVDRVHRIRHVDSMLRPLTDATGVRSVMATFGPQEGAVASDFTLRLLILRQERSATSVTGAGCRAAVPPDGSEWSG